MKLDLLNKEIEDAYIRENFVRIKRELEAQQILSGFWRFFEVDVTQTGVNIPLKHNLSFVPRDIILLSKEGDQNLYFNYENFDNTNIYVTTTGPCRVRFLAGRYEDKVYGGSKTDFAFVPPSSVDEPTWFTGAGNPASELGLAGDFFLNTTSKEIFLKINGEWVSQGYLSTPMVGGVCTGEEQTVNLAANTPLLVIAATLSKIFSVQIYNSAGEMIIIDIEKLGADNERTLTSKKPLNNVLVQLVGIT